MGSSICPLACVEDESPDLGTVLPYACHIHDANKVSPVKAEQLLSSREGLESGSAVRQEAAPAVPR